MYLMDKLQKHNRVKKSETTDQNTSFMQLFFECNAIFLDCKR